MVTSSSEALGQRSKVEGWIGSDESGKGDYFGPLVVAAVFMTPETGYQLEGVGVRDSKKLSDNKARALARIIKGACRYYEVVSIGPQRYNELIDKLRNVNKLLAWGHARAIENVLERVDCEIVKSDQFGDESYIINALFERGKRIHLIQEPRAEADIGVAAASILARAEFLDRLDELGNLLGTKVPKGASSAVEDVARALVEKFGANVLRRSVKYHFKTTTRVLQKV
jgi:ribonuclease HIII